MLKAAIIIKAFDSPPLPGTKSWCKPSLGKLQGYFGLLDFLCAALIKIILYVHFNTMYSSVIPVHFPALCVDTLKDCCEHILDSLMYSFGLSDYYVQFCWPGRRVPTAVWQMFVALFIVTTWLAKSRSARKDLATVLQLTGTNISVRYLLFWHIY